MAATTSIYNRSNLVQSTKIAQQWINNIEKVEAEQHRDYFLAYFVGMTPRFLRNSSHLDQLKAILTRHESNDEKALMVKLLKEEIAEMELIKTIALN